MSALLPGRLRRILLIAFHFPPMAGSSGIQRTLSLVRYLPGLGWEPVVLSANPRAYEGTADDLLREIPPQVHVERTFALDAARHFRFFGRYPGAFARPDRWRSWYWSAVPSGLRLIQRFQPEVIWSTYPIATAHVIAAALHRKSGLPWIADFRDPMAQDGYPEDPKTWQRFMEIEAEAAGHASRLVFVTPGAMRVYAARYPETPRERFVVLENGYDDAIFRQVEQAQANDPAPPDPGRMTLLHSGIVYPSERDPTAFFVALARLSKRDDVNPRNFRVRFRAPVHQELLQRLAAETGTAELIEIAPPIPYRAALGEMMRVDGLVVMQGDNCNEQIPAKLYEYFRARRPVLGLADPAGDTAQALRRAGVPHIAKLEDAAAVEQTLAAFVAMLRSGNGVLPDASAAAMASREARTQQFVELVGQVVAPSL
jgi:Glycosyl transferase 4-like domain